MEISKFFDYFNTPEIHVGDYVKIKIMKDKIGKVALISKEMRLPFLIEYQDENGIVHSAFKRNQLTLLTPEEYEFHKTVNKYNL
jgi:hypothetical protein